ncbi:MAG: hypothetical protein PHW62_00265 [Candidatus Ratteibacteria bacterium]|nr:hypothetical protein [Candidatus Ratteibacteria bacterium]
MTGYRRTLKTIFFVTIALTLIIATVSASTDIEYKKGTHIKQKLELSAVKEVQFIAECNGILTISNSENRVDVLSSCKPRNLYIQFMVSNDKAVYQTKEVNGKKTAIRILQKRIAVSEDGRYNILLTKPESTGRFEFLGDSINKDDNFIVEDAADQTIKANMQTIDIETIMQKDTELYNSLRANNLSSTDKMFYNHIKNAIKSFGLDTVFRNITTALKHIVGG